ncbi:Uncharacterised protein [Mycobacteroides abscessus subsp. abscessus]|nr:Uncharacterised protein [Mycobacteroides abscessus subsp. abscessus]
MKPTEMTPTRPRPRTLSTVGVMRSFTTFVEKVRSAKLMIRDEITSTVSGPNHPAM